MIKEEKEERKENFFLFLEIFDFDALVMVSSGMDVLVLTNKTSDEENRNQLADRSILEFLLRHLRVSIVSDVRRFLDNDWRIDKSIVEDSMMFVD